MNGSNRYEVVSQIARRGCVPAVLLAVALICAGVSLAQSTTEPAQEAKPAPVQSAVAPAKPAPPAASAAAAKSVATSLAASTATPQQDSAVLHLATAAAQAGHPPERTQKDGITVRGHWLIVVRNPDGTETDRREFENSIQPSGMTFLASLLAGNNTNGGLSVLLNGAQTSFVQSSGTIGSGFSQPQANFSEAGPCAPWNGGGELIVNANGTPSTPGTCLIFLATSLLSGVCSSSGSGPGACSTNLTASAPAYTLSGLSSPSLQVSFGGSVLVGSTTSGQINDVETMFLACDPGVTSNTCAVGKAYGVGIFTEKLLDGLNGDPAAVPYSPGQTIGVTITISFQ